VSVHRVIPCLVMKGPELQQLGPKVPRKLASLSVLAFAQVSYSPHLEEGLCM
jgi:hypothetical protein